MPRRRKKSVIRLGLSADEIEARIMALMRKAGGPSQHPGYHDRRCWFLRYGTELVRATETPKISPESMKRFVPALAQVRKEYDLRLDLHAGDGFLHSLMVA